MILLTKVMYSISLGFKDKKKALIVAAKNPGDKIIKEIRIFFSNKLPII